MTLTAGMRQQLEEFFRPEQHKVITKGGAKITHVPVWDVVDRITEVDPDWGMETPIVMSAGGKLVVAVGLTIGGVTRWNFGDEAEEKDDYGSAATNAFAQGFKRAAAEFGVGRYLYDKELAAKVAKVSPTSGGHSIKNSSPSSAGQKKTSEPGEKLASTSEPSQSPQTIGSTTSTSASGSSGPAGTPASTNSPEGSGPRTKNQNALIKRLAGSHTVTEEDKVVLRSKLTEDPSSKGASEVIEWLQAHIKAVEAEEKAQKEALEEAVEDPQMAAAAEALELA
jgi:hypothetical protein